MRVISSREKKVEAGGPIIATARSRGIGNTATTTACEWALKVTNHKGKQIAFQYWWQMSEPGIGDNRIEWTESGQRLFVNGPIIPAVAKEIMDRVSDPERRTHYDAALTSAMADDQQETDDLHAAKLAKAAQREKGTELALTDAQRAALKRDRERTWRIAFAGTVAVILAVGIVVAFVLENDSGVAPQKSLQEPTGCTWEWVPGKAPVDVGWIDAVQYCYPD